MALVLFRFAPFVGPLVNLLTGPRPVLNYTLLLWLALTGLAGCLLAPVALGQQDTGILDTWWKTPPPDPIIERWQQSYQRPYIMGSRASEDQPPTVPDHSIAITLYPGPCQELPKAPDRTCVAIEGGRVSEDPYLATIADLSVTARGQSATWIHRFLLPGAQVQIDEVTGKLTVTYDARPFRYRLYELWKDVLERRRINGFHEGPQVIDFPIITAEGFGSRMDGMLALADTHPDQFPKAYNEFYQGLRDASYAVSKPVPATGLRGMWVRATEESPEDVAQTLDELAHAGITDVFLEIYFQGRTRYPSQVMARYGLPTPVMINSGGWDPIESWIEEGNKRGIRVHGWMQLMYAGHQQDGKYPHGPILAAHPSWANRQRRYATDDTPHSVDSEPGLYFLDPAHPGVRQFLTELSGELLELYAFDGVQWDYVRYPKGHSPVDNPKYFHYGWGYSPVARKRFQDENTPKPPPDTPPEKALKPYPDPLTLTPESPQWPVWTRWRNEQINSLIRTLTTQARQIRPGIMVTAVVFPHFPGEEERKHQQWWLWAEKGWVDGLCPIGLQRNYRDMLWTTQKMTQQLQGSVPIWTGIFGMYHSEPPDHVLDTTDGTLSGDANGIVFFDKSKLTPGYLTMMEKGPFRIPPQRPTTAQPSQHPTVTPPTGVPLVPGFSVPMAPPSIPPSSPTPPVPSSSMP